MEFLTQVRNVYLLKIIIEEHDYKVLITNLYTETAESRGLAFAPGRASGLEPAEVLVWR